MKAIAKTQKQYPHIKFHLYSGNAQYVEEKRLIKVFLI